MRLANNNRPRDPEMRYIRRDGQKWVVHVSGRVGDNFNGRYLTLEEAKTVRDKIMARNKEAASDAS